MSQIDPGRLTYYLSENSAARDKIKKRIILFGDSRIFQWRETPVLVNSEFINRGLNGETTAGALLRLNDDVIKLKPDIVIIQLGINDLTTIGLMPESYNFITNNCITNLDMIINTITDKKISLVILTIFPNSEVSIIRRLVWSDLIENGIKYVNEHIKNINKLNTYTVDCSELLLTDSKVNSDYYNDTLHLNKKGYSVLNRRIAPVINDIISRNSGRQ